jgi:hypothetical protein
LSPFRVALATLYVPGLGSLLYFLAAGAAYYLTPLAERARHPLYWAFKPGGSLGLRFGMAGLAMMTLMHAYSARKRLRPLRKLGALRKWLDVHILLGILGPLFVVLHSSFKVGGLVSISCSPTAATSWCASRRRTRTAWRRYWPAAASSRSSARRWWTSRPSAYG